MAYGATTSLYHTIHLLLMSPHTTITSSTEKLLKIARWGAERLQNTLEKYDENKNSSGGVLAMDTRIREEARNLEYLIQSKASAQFLSQSQRHGIFSLNLDDSRHAVDCFIGRAEKMSAEYMLELGKHEEEEEEEEAVVPVAASTSKSGDVMVGSSDMFLHIRDEIIAGEQGRYISVTGMAGIGKTTFVKKLFHDPLIREKFQYWAFVRVGQKYEFDDVLIDILSQLNIDNEKVVVKGRANIRYNFRKILRGRKYFIVLDDLWDHDKFEHQFKTILKVKWVTETGWILVTSRIDGKRNNRNSYPMSLLSEEESWELMKRKVFGELQECPPQLVKVGKKIAENCEGLPLLILAIAQLLFKSPKNIEFWGKVAQMRNSVFEDAMEKIYEILLTSYHYLAQRSKACFLYMCVFPKDYVIRRSKVNNIWLAEGIADGISYVLDDIVSSNLVVIRQLNWSHEKAKACNLHVVYRYLCKREAENNKLLFILQSYAADGLIGRSIDQGTPRLAIYSNTLLAIKEVHDSIQRLSYLCSVLCTGPYHQYEVPICLDLKLMRVLDALTIRFYEFPVEVVKLIQLRYLSLTTNANLPPSISKLWFLEYLIVHPHLSIINRTSAVESSYLPMEIWELDQLKHLQIIGRNLPHPPPHAILSNLTQLLDVGVLSCASVVLKSLPKLETLRVQIVSAPDIAQATNRFDQIVGLGYLSSLGSVVVNPILLPKPRLPPPRFCISNFMSTLQKLSLSGFGYPWEDMSQIANLPHLHVLKLQCYAFRGEKWEAERLKFWKLRYLLIEDADLVEWTGADDQLSFPSLSHLTMKNCYKLKRFPVMKYVREIELVDCNPLAETWAKRSYKFDVRATYSWK